MSFSFSLLLAILLNCGGFGQWRSGDSMLTGTKSTRIYRKTRGGSETFICASVGTCKANENFSFKTCHCDHYCKHFGDCCWDANLSDKILKLPDKFQYLSCVNFISSIAVPLNANQGFYMVTKCLNSEKNNEFVKKCEEDLDNGIPVTDNNGLTYKNKYCALCHGIVDYLYWSSVFLLETCSRNFDYSSISETDMAKKMDILKEHGCRIVYTPHNPYNDYMHEKNVVFPRFCIRDVKRDFINNGEECSKFLNPFFVRPADVYVRNVFCLNNQSKDYRICLLPSSWYSEIISMRHDLRPMTVLFQFKNYDEKDSQACPYNYKESKEVCVTSPCNITYSKSCIKESLNSYRLAINLFIESGGNFIHLKTFERAIAMFFMSLPVHHYQLKLMAFRLYVSCKESENRRCCFTGSIPVAIQRNITYDEMRKLKLAIHDMKYIYHENVQNVSCIVNRISKTENFTCTEDNLIDRTFVSLDVIQMYVEKIDMGPVGTNNPGIPESAEVKVQVGDEFDPNGIASFIKVLSLKRTFPIQNNSILSSTSLIDIQVVITYSTMGLSALALVIVISVFVYFKLIVNFADQICINIMCTLLFTNVLFMSGIGFVDNPLVCYIIGVVLHFLWLCVFTWVSLFTIMFTVTLWKMEINLTFNPDKNWSKSPLYVAGYGIPAIMASSCVFFEVFWSEFSMNYNSDVCFPTGFPANIIFFTAPVIFSILLNVLLLFFASKLLRRQYVDSLTRPAQVISVYTTTIIKLSLFSGVFWIFGVLSQALRNDVMAFIFIICCGSQGLIFAVCFVTSTRVRRKCFEIIYKTNSSHTSQVNEEIEMN